MDMLDNPNYYFINRTYKSKYICTHCRKVFKRKISSDFKVDTAVEKSAPNCPDCGKLTSWVGPKFRAPKVDNVKTWHSIEILQDIRLLYFFGWASKYIDIPETKKSLDDFLKKTKAEYKLYIKSCVNKAYDPDNKKQVKYFSDRIKKIDIHLHLK